MRSVLIITLLIILFNYACRREPVCTDCLDPDCTFWNTIPADNSDTLFSIEPCGSQTEYLLPPNYNYWDGCFNPRNNNQIAFIRWNTQNIPFIFELCTYDFCNDRLKVLTNTAFSQPDWSIKDWIVFKGAGSQIWKIKSNGDSLTQLTIVGGNANFNRPRWNNNGDRFLVSYWVDNFILDENGVFLDTLPNPSPLFDWDGKSIIYRRSISSVKSEYIYLTDTNFDLKIEIDSSSYASGSGDGLINSFALNPHRDEVFWIGNKRVCVTDFDGNRSQLSSHLNNNWYTQIAVSNDGKKILLNRMDRKRLSPCAIEERCRLYLMEADGSRERKINFPE
jgi:hypothetical protein